MPTQTAACRHCGQPVSSGARFCQNCGADVSVEQSEMATISYGGPARKSAQDSALELLRQETLGEYEILDELGRGGMATVYLAHDIALDRRVAIKVMSTALPDEGLAERFRREARTAASLSHRHIIPIYAVRERGELLYFVMKFVAGQSLDPILKAGPLPIPVAQVILSQAASALGYAHRRGVIHRDVKPANVMLDDDGWVLVTDFGIAKVPSATGLTLTGVTVGTPAYMSPEQCMGKEVTGASDQYSLGVVAYEMLTGRKLFTATTAMAMMYAHFHDAPVPLRQIRPEIPEALEASVLRMLAKEPEERWPKIDDAFTAPVLSHNDPLIEQLVKLATSGGHGARAARISTPTSPIPPARRGTRAAPTATTVPSVPPAAEPAAPPAGPPPRSSETEQMTVAGPPPSAPAALAGATGTAAAPRPSQVAAPPKRTTVTLTGRSQPVWRGWMGWAGLAAVFAVAGGWYVMSRPRTLPAPPAQTTDTTKVRPAGGDTGTSTGAGGTGKIDTTTTAKPPVGGEPPRAAGLARVELSPSRLTLDPGKSAALAANLFAADSSPFRERRRVSWRSSAPKVADVDSRGTVRAAAPGVATITATVDGKSATADVQVRSPTAVPVAQVTVTPADPKVPIGKTLALTAQLVDAQKRALNDRQAIWSSSDSTIASVSSSGVVTARRTGAAIITASAEGQSGRVTVTVPTAQVATVVVAPSPGTLKPGATVQLAATPRDAEGAPLANRKVTWGSSDTKVATVSDGLVTAREAGTATITATVDGVPASVSVSVVAAVDPAAERARATQEITRTLDAFTTALNARDLNGVREIYPGMPAKFEDGWKSMFNSQGFNRLNAVRGQNSPIKFDGDSASTFFAVKCKPDYSGRPADSFTINYQAIFEQTGGKWLLRRLDVK